MALNETYLCYENLLRNGSVVASSEDSDFPVEQCFDGFTNTFFKPAASGTVNIDLTLSSPDSVDYFAYYNTNAGDYSGTIKLQYHNGSTYVDCFSAYTIPSGKPYIKTFTEQTSNLWRVVLTATDISSWADISFGKALKMPYGVYIGYTPPQQDRDKTILNSISQNGSFVGRTVLRKGISTDLSFKGMTLDFVRNYWEGFVNHAELYPFYLLWDKVNYPADNAFVWTDGNIPKPVISNYRHMTVNLSCNGVVE